MMEAILLTLRETWSGYIEGLQLVIPRLLAMLSVVVAGWLIAAIARAVTAKLLGWLRSAASRSAPGPRSCCERPSCRPPSSLVASALFWVLFLGFLLAGLDALGFRTLQALGSEVSLLVPRLVGGLAILAAGLVLANVVWRVVLLAAVNAGWPSARVLGGVVYTLLVTVVAAMALDHVGLARPIVRTGFAIVVGAFMLAIAIAIGTGLGPLVRRMVEERLAGRSRPAPDGSSHL